MKLFTSPEVPEYGKRKSVFLAGSIDNGAAEDWQKKLLEELSDLDIVVLNPRRKHWDASLTQSIDNPVFRGQVEWELQGLEKADYIFMNLASKTLSPITLLELGLHASKGRLIVACASDFWRRGNVEVICNTYNIPLFSELKDAVAMLRQRLS